MGIRLLWGLYIFTNYWNDTTDGFNVLKFLFLIKYNTVLWDSKKFEQRWKITTSFRVVYQYNYKIATRSAVSFTLWFAKHPTQLSRSTYNSPDKTVHAAPNTGSSIIFTWPQSCCKRVFVVACCIGDQLEVIMGTSVLN